MFNMLLRHEQHYDAIRTVCAYLRLLRRCLSQGLEHFHATLLSRIKRIDLHDSRCSHYRFEDFYKLLEKTAPVGMGAYGTVCAAAHRETGEVVAVKQIPRSAVSAKEVTLHLFVPVEVTCEVHACRVCSPATRRPRLPPSEVYASCTTFRSPQNSAALHIVGCLSIEFHWITDRTMHAFATAARPLQVMSEVEILRVAGDHRHIVKLMDLFWDDDLW
jgi:serine/threonine protein kinase